MSRTYNHRPRWVKLNDPTFPTKESHQHYTVRREKSGRTTTQTRTYWRVVDGWPKTETVEYEVPHYYTWVEAVPCSIDIPEKPWREARHDRLSNNREKLCDKRPLISDPCSCCTRRYAKHLSAKAQRASINQQLHNAVRDFGWTADPDEWYDVDITTAGIAEDWKFWD